MVVVLGRMLQTDVKVFGLVRLHTAQGHPRLPNELIMCQLVFIAHGHPGSERQRFPFINPRLQFVAYCGSPFTLTCAAGAEGSGSRHLIGRERLREGRCGREAREVGRDLTDGTDGARADIDGHVLLDGDA
ncbi:hypothetical protein INR49_013639 [Caranx melampygus]|nr:hypothetical protein INR49_013639 [Caranx melampygus]